jgi:hypothetical protein
VNNVVEQIKPFIYWLLRDVRVSERGFSERAAEQVIPADASIACFSSFFLAGRLDAARSARLNSSVGRFHVGRDECGGGNWETP